MLAYIDSGSDGLAVFGTAFADGFFTFLRVAVVVAASSLVWVPVGVWIGFNPRVAQFMQPVVQVLASFPANFIFPFAMVVFLDLGISLNFGSILLMALGTQWYVLFNVIAGASAVPSDLKEATDNLGVHGLGAVAPADHSRHLPGLRDRRDHGGRRCLERHDRGRVSFLITATSTPPAAWAPSSRRTA